MKKYKPRKWNTLTVGVDYAENVSIVLQKQHVWERLELPYDKEFIFLRRDNITLKINEQHLNEWFKEVE